MNRLSNPFRPVFVHPARGLLVALLRPVALLLISVMAAGCASGGSVRELGQTEQEMFQTLSDTLKSNEKMVRKVSEQLGELGVDYTRMEFELEQSVSKAKLLEAMQAPWATPRGEFAETQRAIVLYHFYELELAEDKVLEARIREQRESAREILTAYRKLNKLLEDAAKNLEIILEYMNQPTEAQIRAFTANFLAEVTAFREELQQSENPRLQRLAKDVARYEETARNSTEKAERALEALLKLSE